MVMVSISLRAQAHKRAEVVSAADEMVERMRHSDGCTRARLLADSEDSNALTIVSEWRSATDADGFIGSREFQIFKGVRIMLRGEPVVVFDEVQARVTRLMRSQT